MLSSGFSLTNSKTKNVKGGKMSRKDWGKVFFLLKGGNKDD